MKKYIGTKKVSATPAWRVDGVVYPKDGPVPRVMNREDGYKVVYEDGYESWSPKAVFEKAYNVAETPADRMQIEEDEVCERFLKLSGFIDSGEIDEVVDDAYSKCLLEIQCSTMFDYIRLLNARTKRMEGSEGATIQRMNFGMAIQALKAGYAVRRRGWNEKESFVVKQVPAHISEEIIPKMQSLPQSAKDIIMARDNKSINYTNQMLIINADGCADSWLPSSSDVFAEDWEIVL